MLRAVSTILALLGSLLGPALAEDAPRSDCLAMANAPPRAVPVSLRKGDRAAAGTDEVAITYAGHSTYFIDTPGGVRIATDYNGAYQIGRLPDVVTMNRAHSTHYTLFPDPRIPHVLHGWGENGEPAKIAERIGDVFIRNVTTDIRRFYGDTSGIDMIKDGNSIFIFEVAGLCIGHLGHLHHQLDDSHFAAIGRLDILMVPIDGTYTMSLEGISEITRRLRASVVLPMHRFATPLDEFMEKIGKQFEIEQRSERTLRISGKHCPPRPPSLSWTGFRRIRSGPNKEKQLGRNSHVHQLRARFQKRALCRSARRLARAAHRGHHRSRAQNRRPAPPSLGSRRPALHDRGHRS